MNSNDIKRTLTFNGQPESPLVSKITKEVAHLRHNLNKRNLKLRRNVVDILYLKILNIVL